MELTKEDHEEMNMTREQAAKEWLNYALDSRQTSPTGIALTPEEEEEKFNKVLYLIGEFGLSLRKALRYIQYGKTKFYDYLEAKDLEFTGTEIEFTEEEIRFKEEQKQFTREDRQERYARATRDRETVLLDEIEEIADNTEGDTFYDRHGNIKLDKEFVMRSKVKIEVRMWMLGKMNPSKYGAKSEHIVKGEEGAAPILISLGGGINPEAPQENE